jgi:hypothetical protein
MRLSSLVNLLSWLAVWNWLCGCNWQTMMASVYIAIDSLLLDLFSCLQFLTSRRLSNPLCITDRDSRVFSRFLKAKAVIGCLHLMIGGTAKSPSTRHLAGEEDRHQPAVAMRIVFGDGTGSGVLRVSHYEWIVLKPIRHARIIKHRRKARGISVDLMNLAETSGLGTACVELTVKWIRIDVDRIETFFSRKLRNIADFYKRVLLQCV